MIDTDDATSEKRHSHISGERGPTHHDHPFFFFLGGSTGAASGPASASNDLCLYSYPKEMTIIMAATPPNRRARGSAVNARCHELAAAATGAWPRGRATPSGVELEPNCPDPPFFPPESPISLLFKQMGLVSHYTQHCQCK
eukprot:m.119181 g.119181  ORF g.119181 m.119181 type:complete len:141 (+) comp21778_c0_seq1:280-702(+)